MIKASTQTPSKDILSIPSDTKTKPTTPKRKLIDENNCLPTNLDETPNCVLLTKFNADAKRQLHDISPEKLPKFDCNPLSSTTSDESSDDDDLPGVAKIRHNILSQKQALVKQLGIVELRNDFHQDLMKEKALKLLAKKVKEENPQSKLSHRKSLRLIRKESGEEEKAAEDTPKIPVIELPEEELVPRKPSEQFEMKADGFDLKKEDEEKETESQKDYERFLENLHVDLDFPNDDQLQSTETKSLHDSLQNMKLISGNSQKLVKSRIVSLAIHPTNEKILIAAGDNFGHLGLWDAMKNDSNGGAYQFSPHIRSITCLKYSPTHPNRLFMSSQDGQLRFLDLEKLVFEKTLADNEDSALSGFDFWDSGNCLVASSHTGCVEVIDIRVPSNVSAIRFRGDNNVANSVSAHPIRKKHVAVAFRNRSVRIFDLRRTSRCGKMSSPVVSLYERRRSVTSAYFSPLTGRQLLTTSLHDHIRLYDTRSLRQDYVEMVAAIPHNNQTGGCLSKFQATWHPRNEDTFVVGSMLKPRRIEVFDSSLNPLHIFTEPEIPSTICSANAFHPTRNVLAGGNRDGRVFVFGEPIQPEGYYR